MSDDHFLIPASVAQIRPPSAAQAASPKTAPAPLAVLYSRALAGVDAPLVTVEVHLGNGLPAFNIVGLAEAEVREARDRVRAALSTCGFDFPARRITVNLAPADLPKESGRFDLPIALGILVASQQLPGEVLARTEFAGELSLTGELRPVRGALAMALGAARAGRCFILPLANAAEAALAGGVAGGAPVVLASVLRCAGPNACSRCASTWPDVPCCRASSRRSATAMPPRPGKAFPTWPRCVVRRR